MRVTRLAPSPTGALHLGNARTFLINWALARQSGWRIVLRIDDLDTPRTKTGADRQALNDLRWLGIDWDEGPVYESDHLPHYEAALHRLADTGRIFPCSCTRSEIAAASMSAPHAEEHDLRYPGTCRPEPGSPPHTFHADLPETAWRFRVDDRVTTFHDHVAGTVSNNLHQSIGDFLVTNKTGIASYQLACVIDDFLAGVTDIVRGDDLLASTPRQMVLQEALGLPPCDYWHLPLVVGSDGRRLAKRHGDTRLASFREAGVPASDIIGLLARWSGIPGAAPGTADEFANRFELERLPRQQIKASSKSWQKWT